MRPIAGLRQIGGAARCRGHQCRYTCGVKCGGARDAEALHCDDPSGQHGGAYDTVGTSGRLFCLGGCARDSRALFCLVGCAHDSKALQCSGRLSLRG